METFLAKELPHRYLAEGCTKYLLDARLELTPLESGAALNRRRYQLGYWPGK